MYVMAWQERLEAEVGWEEANLANITGWAEKNPRQREVSQGCVCDAQETAEVPG